MTNIKRPEIGKAFSRIDKHHNLGFDCPVRNWDFHLALTVLNDEVIF